jgi:hypothetical protein
MREPSLRARVETGRQMAGWLYRAFYFRLYDRVYRVWVGSGSSVIIGAKIQTFVRERYSVNETVDFHSNIENNLFSWIPSHPMKLEMMITTVDDLFSC